MRRCEDEANVSAEPDPSQACPRLPSSYEDPSRPRRTEAQTRKRAEATRGLDSIQVAMALRTGRFSWSDRIQRSWQFQRISKQGRRVASQHFILLVAPRPALTGGQSPQLGITVSQRVGKAVVRNRVKRMIREWFRHRRSELPRGCEMVVIARRPAAALSAPEVSRVLSTMLRELAPGGSK